MLTLTKRYPFSAAHRLWNDALSPEENQKLYGPCINIHGHNYTVEVTVAGKPSPETGMIIDIVALDALVKRCILSAVDHRYLDVDVPFLQGKLSTVENVAQAFYQRLVAEIPPAVKLYRVRVFESEQNWAEVSQEENLQHA